MKEFHDFIQYCLQNHDNPEQDSLSRLHEEYSKLYNTTFSLLDFMKWKNKVDQLSLLEDFNSFPFLRDEAFLHYLKESSYSFLHENGKCHNHVSFPEFIKIIQINYYKIFIDTRLTTTITSTAPSTVSKCPFAQSKTKSSINDDQFVLDRSVRKVKYSTFASNNIHIISTFECTTSPQTVIRILDRSTKNYVNEEKAKYLILTAGIHEDLDFNSTIIIMTTESYLKITTPVFSPILSSSALETLLSVKKNLLSGIDAQLLFPNIIAIHPDDLDIILNLMVYSEVLGVGFKSTFREIRCKVNLQPSPLEPYLDLLTPEFIIENTDLFVSK